MYSEEIDMCLLNFDEQLDKNLAHLKDELLQIRAGRANPKIIERVVVDYYGTPTPLSQLYLCQILEWYVCLCGIFL